MQMHILPVTPLAQQAPTVAPTSSENPGTVPPWLTTIRRPHNGNPGIVPPWFTGTSFGSAPTAEATPAQGDLASAIRASVVEPGQPVVTDPDQPHILD